MERLVGICTYIISHCREKLQCGEHTKRSKSDDKPLLFVRDVSTRGLFWGDTTLHCFCIPHFDLLSTTFISERLPQYGVLAQHLRRHVTGSKMGKSYARACELQSKHCCKMQ
ncbi:hypothetical protein POVWA2_012360 [Plasmodium ovale wallikeri]|uniref:Uncharacterized protein n=1 Tax=Plasmodium ovale wallikeri TaxID=864142 RepID=A0A1A8YN17_PLAOA|nr:hypothetical protein POVWA2_012360 [Plasmodium ovale wallikeri]